MTEQILRITGLCKSYSMRKETVAVLDHIDLTVSRGEFVSVVGHSGCGKSTLLKIVAGLEAPDSGEVWVCGKRVTEPTAHCGLVFQSPRLMPWLRARDNVCFGLSGKKQEKRALADHYLGIMSVADFKNAYPAELSGGMAQRVALARGIATNPELLLLDEPFSALDALTRARLSEELVRIAKARGMTVILVTHDIGEAVRLGDRVAVLTPRPGRVAGIIDVREAKGESDETAEAGYRSEVARILG